MSIYRLTERKKHFFVQNRPSGTVGVKIGYVLGLLVHGKIVIDLVGKYSSLKMAKISITERPQAFFIHTKTPSVIIQGNLTVMRYWNGIIRSVLLLHIHANLDMMLAWDYTSRHAARSTLVMLVANHVQQLRWPAKSRDLNPIDHLLDLLKRKVRAQPLH